MRTLLMTMATAFTSDHVSLALQHSQRRHATSPRHSVCHDSTLVTAAGRGAWSVGAADFAAVCQTALVLAPFHLERLVALVVHLLPWSALRQSWSGDSTIKSGAATDMGASPARPGHRPQGSGPAQCTFCESSDSSLSHRLRARARSEPHPA